MKLLLHSSLPGGHPAPAAECYDSFCTRPASGRGDAFFICEHEHIIAAPDFCFMCWEVRELTPDRWNCSRCYGQKPGGGREEWGHLCPMTLVFPAGNGRMST